MQPDQDCTNNAFSLRLQVERLQSVINKLKAENVEYRNNSKTDQFEARIQELEKKLQDTGAQQHTLACYSLSWIAPAHKK